MSTERTIDATKVTPSATAEGDAKVMLLSANGGFQPVTLDTLVSLVKGNIQIGGRNLLKGTAEPFSNPYPTGWSYQCVTPTVAGKTYMLSFDIDWSKDVALPYMEIYFDTKVGGAIANRDMLSPKPTVRGHHEILFTPTKENTLFAIYTNNADADIRLSNVKLEEGNIATAWSPAFEDYQPIGGGKSIFPICYTSHPQSTEKGVRHERQNNADDRIHTAFAPAECSDKARNGGCWIEFEYGHSAGLLSDSKLGYRKSSPRHAEICNARGASRILPNAHDCPDAKSVPFHSFAHKRRKRYMDKVDKVLRRISLTPGKEVVAA